MVTQVLFFLSRGTINSTVGQHPPPSSTPVEICFASSRQRAITNVARAPINHGTPYIKTGSTVIPPQFKRDPQAFILAETQIISYGMFVPYFLSEVTSSIARVVVTKSVQ